MHLWKAEHWVLNLCVPLKPEQSIEQGRSGSAFFVGQTREILCVWSTYLGSSQGNTMTLLAQEVTMSVARACVKLRSCTATLWAYCKAAVGVPTCVLCSCCGGRAELTRISLYTGPKVLGISHSVGICDMVNIQDLH